MIEKNTYEISSKKILKKLFYVIWRRIIHSLYSFSIAIHFSRLNISKQYFFFFARSKVIHFKQPFDADLSFCGSLKIVCIEKHFCPRKNIIIFLIDSFNLKIFIFWLLQNSLSLWLHSSLSREFKNYFVFDIQRIIFHYQVHLK